MKFISFLICAFALVMPAYATDHGPAFGYATPVNSQGECSFDTGVIGRHGSLGTQLTASSLVGCGITPHITISANLPITFGSGSLPETRMAGGGEWSSSVAWRFLHSVTGVGRRVESTASLGIVVPGPQQDSGVLTNLHRAPGVAGTIASGLASRSQYVWFGGGYTRFAEADHDQRPDTISWSAVYGYRPPRLRRDVNHWDYRGFAELTGEHTGQVKSQGMLIPQSQSTTVWLGPSILAIFKDIAIEGGVQAPLYRDVNASIYGRESVRFVVNLSYLHYSSHTHSH
jgi:hypothetical protein